MLLWYVVPSFASLLEVSETFSLFSCDKRLLNVTADFLFFSILDFLFHYLIKFFAELSRFYVEGFQSVGYIGIT